MMDKSETNIKMCDCPGIQDMAPWQQTDTIASRVFIVLDEGGRLRQSDLLLYFDGKLAGSMSTEPFPLRYIWLPRQDQLQEMVLLKEPVSLLPPLQTMILDFHKFTNPEDFCLHKEDREPGFYSQGYCKICFDQRNEREQQFTSMEQLWLAFVMKEKYDKTWNGTEWHNGD